MAFDIKEKLGIKGKGVGEGLATLILNSIEGVSGFIPGDFQNLYNRNCSEETLETRRFYSAIGACVVDACLFAKVASANSGGDVKKTVYGITTGLCIGALDYLRREYGMKADSNGKQLEKGPWFMDCGWGLIKGPFKEVFYPAGRAIKRAFKK